MTRRSVWPMRIEAGATHVGTARVRDDSRPTMTAAQREIFKRTGNRPQVDAAFDEIADGLDAFPELSAGAAMPGKPPKYRNTRCEHEGIRFDSVKERNRWFELMQQQVRGEIRDLRLQVRYELTPRKRRDDGTWERASFYVADFVYINVSTGKVVVEDVKSPATRKNRAYVQKRKAMLDKHGISIREV
ncbi:DUF1064 domain-containing protein [Burkholderia glumae]|uniref:DUF1064 domain-containing protein n=1 Tax=Burkholderia glumae TaxID=337 RepID=UPI0020368B1B|nr:DUF1064 domain-containing protein [Burkholderia glumae]MCM2543890.1 DUF1064 domain-containing protein [Burkholderia glumae]